eukprot:c16527_g1_i1 orf=144-1913(-)
MDQYASISCPTDCQLASTQNLSGENFTVLKPVSVQKIASKSSLSRGDFPSGFIFGVSSSAFQIEGAVQQDGRALSIWDSYMYFPDNIYDGNIADVSCDHYNRAESDVQLMVDLGVSAYRFSISWCRIFSDGTKTLNHNGVSHYNKLINCLVKNSIQPYVTLYHWDLPQLLENDPDIKGWRTKEIVTCYSHFVETCFRLFGDRVKHWITFNEIHLFAFRGYGTGEYAPGRCSLAGNPTKLEYSGDSSTEPYIVAHNALLAHSAAVKIYREKYQAEQRGKIGIACHSQWYEPFSKDTQDMKAAERCLEFELGWILDPILEGDYPLSMREGAGNRLPYFTEDESKNLKGSIDFIGINYYTTSYARNATEEMNPSLKWYKRDRRATTTAIGPDGALIGELMGPPGGLGWIHNCPWGLPKLLGWIEERYGRVPVVITENGCMDLDSQLPLKKCLNDQTRIRYLSDLLQHLADGIKKQKYNVQGYFVWSIMDNFEWNSGFACRMGLYYVDYAEGQKRYPKSSAIWFKDFLYETSDKGVHYSNTNYSSSVKSKGEPIYKMSTYRRLVSTFRCCLPILFEIADRSCPLQMANNYMRM